MSPGNMLIMIYSCYKWLFHSITNSVFWILSPRLIMVYSKQLMYVKIYKTKNCLFNLIKWNDIVSLFSQNIRFNGHHLYNYLYVLNILRNFVIYFTLSINWIIETIYLYLILVTEQTVHWQRDMIIIWRQIWDAFMFHKILNNNTI